MGNTRYQGSQYRPYSHGYNHRPAFAYQQHGKARQNMQGMLGNQQRGKLSNLLVGGLGLASGLYLANKYRRPSYEYGYNPYQYGYAGYPSRPGYNYNTLGYRQREGADTDIEHLLAQLEDSQAANYGLYQPFYQDLPLYY